jgi:hypothetical protein
MLQEHIVVATVAVRNLAAAKRFYENTLIGTARPQTPGVTVYKCGNLEALRLRIALCGHQSGHCGDLARGCRLRACRARSVQANGVQFEHYDLPDMRHEGVVHVMGDARRLVQGPGRQHSQRGEWVGAAGPGNGAIKDP